MRPWRQHEHQETLFRTGLPDGTLAPAPRRGPAAWAAAAASPALRPVRRAVRAVLAETAVFIVFTAVITVIPHGMAAQLSPPAPPTAVCGNPGILSGPSSPPGGAVTVPAGDNSSLFSSQLPASTTYWFAPGTHTIGSGPFAQIQPGTGSTFIGAPGAIIDGQGLNQFAFVSNNPNVNIEYLTIQNFIPPGGQGAINVNGEQGWNIEYSTVQDNLPGAALLVGSDNTIADNCLTENGEYGFNAYTVNDTSALTGGVSDTTITGNEISYNDTCNWEDDASFPITPPAGCTGAGQFVGCGCSGGGKYWEGDTGTFSDNYVHDNYAVGAWWDTNNTGMTITGNYFSNNYATAIIYEISYNASIQGNVFVRNAIGVGPNNPGFPSSAIYLSESGSDSRVPGPYGTSFAVTGNQFYDNWGGVILWENSNRFCTSVANTSTGTCTLVNPGAANLTTCAISLTPPQGAVRAAVPPRPRGRPQGAPPSPAASPSPPAPARQAPVHAGGAPGRGGTAQGQGFQNLIAGAPYIDDCRWKTQNVSVSGNLFDFSPSDIGATCTVANECGFNGVFSEFGSIFPYEGTRVEDNITFNQDNLFSANTYCGPWMFDALSQGDQYTFAQWQGSPYDQDGGSTLNSAACTPAATVPPPPVMHPPQNRSVGVPARIGRY